MNGTYNTDSAMKKFDDNGREINTVISKGELPYPEGKPDQVIATEPKRFSM